MSVHQRKDGRWIVQYRIKGTNKLKTEYFGRGPEAEKNAREKNKQLSYGTVQRRTPTEYGYIFEILANQYLISKYGLIEKSTLENLQYKLRGVLFPAFGHLQAGKITPYILDQFVIKRLKSGVKRTTVHRDISDIQAILNWSVERRYLLKNPISGYHKPARDDAIIMPPSPKEIESIISNSPGHLIRSLLLSYYTGIRPGRKELFSLSWEDVNFAEKIIFVRSAAKNGLRYRIVPIHLDFLPLMERWYQEDNLDDGPIIRYNGKMIKSIKSAFNKAKLKAGITRRLRPYDFRHAFATYMLKNNADLKSTSRLLGHSRPDTTIRIYQHVDNDMQRAAIQKLPRIDT